MENSGIIQLHLSSGEDMIAELYAVKDNKIGLLNPVKFVSTWESDDSNPDLMREYINLIPAMAHCTSNIFYVDRSNIIMLGDCNEEITAKYFKLFSKKLAAKNTVSKEKVTVH